MLLKIIMRELVDLITTLRFALAFSIILVLMALGGYVTTNQKVMDKRKYDEAVFRKKALVQGMNSLAKLNSPQEIWRLPSDMSFLAGGSDHLFPSALTSTSFFISKYWKGGSFWSFWRSQFEPSLGRPVDLNPSFGSVKNIDWLFVVGVVMSFMVLLVSYDAISGEKEGGTLRLALSSPLARVTLLMGKYLAIFMSMGLVLFAGILLNAAIVFSSGEVELGASLPSMIVLGMLCLVYISGFIWLGLFISSSFSKPFECALISILFWTGIVVLIPKCGGLLVANFQKVEPAHVISRKINQLEEEERRKVGKLFGPTDEDAKRTGAFYRWLGNTIRLVVEENRQQSINRALLARKLTSISPKAALYYAGEELAGSGFSAFLEFYFSARNFRSRLHEFIIEEDLKDPISLHEPNYTFNRGKSDGLRPLMSWKPFPKSAVPNFRHTERDLSKIISNISAWILVLFGFNAICFVGAYRRFQRYDVR